MYEGIAVLGPLELANNERTVAYLQNCNGATAKPRPGCGCSTGKSVPGVLCDPPTNGWTSPDDPLEYGEEGALAPPLTAPAPWYNAAIPESSLFLGWFVQSVSGLDANDTRALDQTSDLLRGRIGRRVRTGRTMTFTAWFFGSTEPALQYGWEWFGGQIDGDPCDPCGLQDLEVLSSCPPFSDGDPVRFVRRYLNAAIIDGPKILERHPRRWLVQWTVGVESADVATSIRDVVPLAGFIVSADDSGACEAIDCTVCPPTPVAENVSRCGFTAGSFSTDDPIGSGWFGADENNQLEASPLNGSPIATVLGV